jgi:WD40 repeat protein
VLDIDVLRLYDTTAKLSAGPTCACDHAFDFGPGVDQLAVAFGNRIELRDLATSAMRDLSCKEKIRKLKFIDRDRLIVTTENDVLVFDLATGKVAMRLGHHEWTTALATSPDGKTVAIGHHGTVVLWDLVKNTARTFQVPGRSRASAHS